MVADPERSQHQRPRPAGAQPRRRAGVRRAHAHGQHAAVEREAGHGVDHRLRGGVDRRVGGERGQGVLQPRHPPGRQQHRLDRVAAAADQRAQHHLALGHEPAAPPGEVAVAYVAVGRQPRVGGVVDGDDRGHGG